MRRLLHKRLVQGLGAGMLLGLALTACSGRPPPTLYTFQAPMAGEYLGKPMAVLTLKVPEYLDRSELIMRQGQNALKLHDDDRWAEPLSESTARVMAQSLSQGLKARVVPNRLASGLEPLPAYGVVLTTFEADERGLVTLKGSWRLTGKNVQTRFGVLDVSVQAEGTSPAAIVAAMNQAAIEAGQEISRNR